MRSTDGNNGATKQSKAASTEMSSLSKTEVIQAEQNQVDCTAPLFSAYPANMYVPHAFPCPPIHNMVW